MILLSILLDLRWFRCIPEFKFALNFTPPEVPMATNFTISSDSESELSEEVEEEGNSQLLTNQEQEVFQRHTLTLPELRMSGRTAYCNVGRGLELDASA